VAFSLWDAAVASGRTADRPLTGGGHGRNGRLYDPFGHRWNLYTALRI
jgi:uncharacterized glyoxalase superfamily protein PhnB